MDSESTSQQQWNKVVEGLTTTNGSSVNEERRITIPHQTPPPREFSSSNSLTQKSDNSLLPSIQSSSLVRKFMINFRVVVLGTRLCLLLPAVFLAILAQNYHYRRPWIFAYSLIGLVPLAERISFLTEQIAHYTGPTVGGLLNATCGNATELIIAILALYKGKITVLKYSLLGSILSNLLLVLGSSLLCGGIANLHKEQTFDKNQSNLNILLLLLGLSCHCLPLFLVHTTKDDGAALGLANSILQLSRASSVLMLIAYAAYIFFQLKSLQQIAAFNSTEGNNDDNHDDDDDDEEAEIGLCSAVTWLVGITMTIALLSEYIVGTIEAASSSSGIPIGFLSIILLPIVGNAAEHASAIIFAFRNKLDICLGVAVGSATQISMFVVPLCVIIAWMIGVQMDLSLGLLETGSFALSILIVAFSLQDGTSHYMKGLVLLLSYVLISICFFVHKSPHGGQVYAT